MKEPESFHAGSNKRVLWVCDCGRETSVSVQLVTSGNTSSCGRCNVLSSDHFADTKYGKLRMKEPESFHAGSGKKVLWVCDCGRFTSVSVVSVVLGRTSSCGHCNVLSPDHFADTKYGKLRMKDPESFHPGSEKNVRWLCDCGKETTTKVCYVVSGQTSSCGRCNVIRKDEWSHSKYGRLRMRSPVEAHPQSHMIVTWDCDCGGELDSAVHNVTRGLTVSCGTCYGRAVDWYGNNKEEILSLKPPILPSDIPSGHITLLATVVNTGDPVPVLCGSCGSRYAPRWDNVRLGRSLTCGCATNRVSKAQLDVFSFICGLGVDAELETEIGGFKYDILVPSSSILIEYHGLKWHSGEDARRRDLKKFRNALSHGYDLIAIFEDEWRLGEDKVKRLLQNRLRTNVIESVRPSKCDIVSIGSRCADSFLDDHHYIGPAKARVNYGVFLRDELIAVASFKRPTRQTSRHSWELVRMASHPAYRIHGIWGKLLKFFVLEYSPSSVVSFSDNRLFSGAVYGKIGFRYDGEVRPDYYWVKNQRRYHKSGLRKKGPEILSSRTETELRTDQGYEKIWDLGKKRWVLEFS